MIQSDSTAFPQKPKQSSGKRKAAARSDSTKTKPTGNGGGAFKVVDNMAGWFQCLTNFETDLPPHCRTNHPSGILHVFGSSGPDANTVREEQAIVWIEDSFYVETALSAIKERGLDAGKGASFLPYSTKENWAKAYPHAKLTLVCSADGTCTAVDKPPKKRRKGGKAAGSLLLRDNQCLPDAERDELHVEIYRYLRWLHSRLIAREEEARAVAGDEGEANAAERGPSTGRYKRDFQWVMRNTHGVHVSELGAALEKLADAFGVIKHVVEKEEEEEARTGGTKGEEWLQEDDNNGIVLTGTPEEEANGDQGRTSGEERTSKKEGFPLLERALVPVLSMAVSARVAAGKRRRRRRWAPPPDPNAKPKPSKEFSLEERLAILEEIRHGDKTQTEIIRTYGTTKTSVHRWKKIEDVMRQQVAEERRGNLKRTNVNDPLKRIKRSLLEFYELNETMSEESKIALTQGVICARAIMIKTQLLEQHEATPFLTEKEVEGMSKFGASTSWAGKFMKSIAPHGEAG